MLRRPHATRGVCGVWGLLFAPTTAHRDTETPPAILSAILPLRRSRCKWFAQRTVLEPTSSTPILVYSLKASRRTIATHHNGQSLASHTNPLYCSHEPWLPLLIIKTTRILRRLLPPHTTLPAPRPLPPPLRNTATYQTTTATTTPWRLSRSQRTVPPNGINRHRHRSRNAQPVNGGSEYVFIYSSFSPLSAHKPLGSSSPSRFPLPSSSAQSS